MSPKTGEEVYLTELEVEVLRVFTKRQEFSDENISHDLTQLVKKLQGRYNESTA